MKLKIKRALISVYNKTGLTKILPLLKKNKVEILSSGGTYKFIKKCGIDCKEVSKFTGTEEILGGRVKTLHPKIHGGILFKRKNKKHMQEMKKKGFSSIDLVIVNFYPFEKTISETKNENRIIENIDIGGPTLLRAAAKNYKFVNIISNIEQLDDLVKELKVNNGFTTLNFRKNLSEKAFKEVAFYDTCISNYFSDKKNNFPENIFLNGTLIEEFRYGENPHQKGALYNLSESSKITQLSGKKLSYNNYSDICSGLEISKSLPKNIGTVIIKHSNPCGISAEKNQVHSFEKAFNCDPISAYGGVVVCNYKLNERNAKRLSENFFEVIVSNNFDKKALNILKKKKNLRIIDSSKVSLESKMHINSALSNLLIQTPDYGKFDKSNFKIVSKLKPNKSMLNELLFAFNVCRFVKSNAIVLSSNLSTVGIGSGQPSRLDSCNIAVNKMNKFNLSSKNLVAASDAFFPFVDGIEKLVQSGVKAVIQPFGSIRDKEIIKFANRTGTILVFSKTRHFKH